MDDLQKNLLLELECPICTQYMSPPIRQCATGHSICEPCRRKLHKCPLCNSEFSDARNLSLEALAGRIQYPCINVGCPAKLTLTNREYHEKNCGFRNYKCAMENCGWSGGLHEVVKHWQDKKACKSYKSSNLCHTKISNSMFFVNLVEANNEIYWYKCKILNGYVYFAVQLIGLADKSESFYYEIEIFKPGHQKRRLLLGEYCQSIHLTDEDLFKPGACAYINVDSLNNFIGIDKMMIYHLRINAGQNKSQNQSRPQHQQQLSAQSSGTPVYPDSVTTSFPKQRKKNKVHKKPDAKN